MATKPVLNERKCLVQEEYCKAIPACTENAISYVADEHAKLGGHIVFDYDLCIGCGDCAVACCGSAIDLIETEV